MTCLRWTYYCVAMNIKRTMRCWLGYYEFGLLMNGSMSITKDLRLYFIGCNCDKWLYEYYEGSTVVFYWMKLWQMVVWVLRKINCCILLNVIVTNGCMSITKDLLLYFIGWNCDKWLYEYYERSTVVFYWM
jgi:hypothetical protein